MSSLADVAAGTRTIQRPYVLTLEPYQQIAQSDSSRYAIGFSLAVAANITVTTLPGQNDTGFVLVTNSGIVWFTVKDHGAFPQLNWYVRETGNADTITIWEVLIPKG